MQQHHRPVMFLLLFVGMIGDGFLSCLSFLKLLGVQNTFTYVLTLSAAFVVTGLTAFTKPILSGDSTAMKVLWGGAVMMDAMTTVFGILSYVQPTESFQVIIAFGLIFFLTGSSLALSFVWDSSVNN